MQRQTLMLQVEFGRPKKNKEERRNTRVGRNQCVDSSGIGIAKSRWVGEEEQPQQEMGESRKQREAGQCTHSNK
jgi:hypothetical protein